MFTVHSLASHLLGGGPYRKWCAVYRRRQVFLRQHQSEWQRLETTQKAIKIKVGK